MVRNSTCGRSEDREAGQHDFQRTLCRMFVILAPQNDANQPASPEAAQHFVQQDHPRARRNYGKQRLR